MSPGPEPIKNKLDFEGAFLEAWRLGQKTFMWEGNLYTTERSDSRPVTDVVE